MAALRASGFGVALCSIAAAQQRIECRDALDNLERFAGKDTGNVQPPARLQRALLSLSGLLKPPMTAWPVIKEGTIEFYGGRMGREDLVAVTSVLAQLRRPDLQELRVQCTLVSMPPKVAVECGLSAGKCVAVDEGQAGKVLKEALAAKGTLCNLPEAGGLPLRPLVFERQGDERRLRLEILPIADDEACFMFQMMEGRLPVDRTLFPDHRDIDARIRLKVGAGAMALVVKDDQATVAWLRFIGTRKAEPAPAQDAKDMDMDKGGNGRPPAPALALPQQRQVFEVLDVLDNLERFGGKDPQRMTRLRLLLAHAFQDANVRFSTVEGVAARKFAAIASPDVIRAVQEVVAQLRRQDLQELRLQCTQVVMPLPVAAAAGLATDKVVEVDEIQAGKVIKDALAAKGTLRNLPEAGVLPVEPCVMSQPRGEDASARAEPEPFARPEIRVQALPLCADEAWFALQWRGQTQAAAGAAPAEAAGAEPQFETAIRLQAGKGAMVMSVQGQHAVVLWVRLCFTRAAEPAHDKQGKGG